MKHCALRKIVRRIRQRGEGGRIKRPPFFSVKNYKCEKLQEKRHKCEKLQEKRHKCEKLQEKRHKCEKLQEIPLVMLGSMFLCAIISACF